MMTWLTTVVMHLKLGNLSLMAFQHRHYKPEVKFESICCQATCLKILVSSIVVL